MHCDHLYNIKHILDKLCIENILPSNTETNDSTNVYKNCEIVHCTLIGLTCWRNRGGPVSTSVLFFVPGFRSVWLRTLTSQDLSSGAVSSQQHHEMWSHDQAKNKNLYLPSIRSSVPSCPSFHIINKTNASERIPLTRRKAFRVDGNGTTTMRLTLIRRA